MPLEAGTRLGPYEILSSLGKGGMGHVYKARDTRLNRLVALKVAKEKYSQRTEREARAVAALNHPHVCQLYDVGPNYLVMELVEGEKLHGPLPPPQAIEYARQILDALEAAHRKGIIHRDLKPSNIFVTKSGIKLLDFGLAKIHAKAVSVEEETVTDGITTEGQVVGSLNYISPEQLQGFEADARSDLFCFGLVFFEMLTGKRAFHGSSADLIADIMRSDPPGLADLARIAPKYEAIVRRCLAKDPNERWQSARDLKQVLEWSMGGPAPNPRRPKISWAEIGVAALFVMLAVGLWLARSPRTPIIQLRYLTYSGRDSAPSASPDAHSIAFASTRDGVSRIWLKELARGAEVPLTAGPDTLPRFSPDGAMILFARFEGGRSSLYRINTVGGEPRKIADDALSGDWSPDGHRIVFLRQRRELSARRTVMGIVGADGGGEQIVFDSDPKWSPELPLRWSPDGRTIAATQGGLASASPSSIFLIDADGKHPRTITAAKGGFFLSSLVWLGPDEVLYAQTEAVGPVGGGTRGMRHNLRSGETRQVFSTTDIVNVVDVFGSGRVVFDAARPSRNLREIDLRAKPGVSAERILTRGLSHDRQPTYSLHGDAVLFSSNRSGNLDLWRLSFATGSLQQITDDPANDWDPAYSPDGQNIAWSSNRGGHQEIWMARADGGQPRQISNDGQDAENPVFLRDGRSILYVSWNEAKRGVWKIHADRSEARLLLPDYMYAEVSADGRYFVSLSRSQTIHAFDTADASRVPFEILDAGRMRWMPDSRGIAFVSRNEKGIPGVFVQQFAPGKDTSKSRHPLGGFDPDRIADTFGISPDGNRLAISSTENVSNLIVASPVEVRRAASTVTRP
jgi:serine/threonine protein kinase